MTPDDVAVVLVVGVQAVRRDVAGAVPRVGNACIPVGLGKISVNPGRWLFTLMAFYTTSIYKGLTDNSQASLNLLKKIS